MPHPGLEPGPSDPESSALTTGPLTPPLMCSESIEKSASVWIFGGLLTNSQSKLKCDGKRNFVHGGISSYLPEPVGDARLQIPLLAFRIDLTLPSPWPNTSLEKLHI